MMKDKKTLIVCIILFACFSFIPLKQALASESQVYVDDQAGLLTSSEIETLNQKILSIQKKYDFDVVILTVPSRDTYSATKYINDYVDERMDHKEISENLVICFRDVEDRWLEIRGYEKAQTYITEARANSIIDEMTPDIRKDEYYDGFLVFLEEVDHYLGIHPNPLTWTWVQLLIGCVIGAIITVVMVSHSGGKVTTTNRTYFDAAHSGLVARRDTYLTTTVHRVKIQTSSGGGSGGGGRSISSGGRSSSGAGRRV